VDARVGFTLRVSSAALLPPSYILRVQSTSAAGRLPQPHRRHEHRCSERVQIPIVDVFGRYSREDFLELQMLAVVAALSVPA